MAMTDDSAALLRVAVVAAEARSSTVAWLASLPNTVGLAVVLVSSLSVDDVRAATRLPVIAATDGVLVEPGKIYVAPADREVRFARGHLVLGPATSTGAAFDVALRSAADELGPASIGMVLAGHSVSGALGIQRIKEAGGWTLAQDVDSDAGEMPRAAIGTGCVDLVLPVDQLVPRLMESLAHDTGNGSPTDASMPETAADALRDIFTLVRIRSGHDFTGYKRATLHRRIARRMAVCECATLVEYHRELRDRPNELGSLLREFFIGVTQFFRDPIVFDALAREVVPRLFANRSSKDEIRIWVAGCATGEEVYSLGILLLEHAALVASPPHIQIFATDIDEGALEVARAGCYSSAIAVDVSPERLERFFSDDNGRRRVSNDLCDLVLFSAHNLLRDPPFSHLDLVSCRNLLMYLERDAQNLALSRFHFALQPDGVLVLGTSESAEGSPTFATVDSKLRLFVRRPSSRATGEARAASWQPPAAGSSVGVPPERTAPVSDLHYRLLEQYAPPSLLVNGDLEVIHLSEHAGRYLGMSGGEPTRQLLRLVHPALRIDLRAAIYAARKTGSDVRAVRFDDADGTHALEIRVRRLELAALGRGAVLVMLAELEPQAVDRAASVQSTSIEPMVREIEDELHRTRDQLRATVEQYEASLEELKASNEELQAANEELRSATEEIETSKEELQAMNEELTALNYELNAKVDEVGRAHSDLQNLMTSTEIAVVFLDRQLEIKRFTPKAQGLFNVIASDIGRPLAHLTHRLDCTDLCDTARSVLHTLAPVERELRSRDGRNYLARWLPYRSIEDRIDGVVLTFIDVTDLHNEIAARRRSEETLRLIEERLHIALRSAPIAILGFDAGPGSPGDATGAAWGFVLGRELAAQQRTALTLFAPGHGERLRASVQQAVETGTGQRTELDLVIEDQVRTFDFRVEPSASGATAVGFDITPSKLAEASLRDADRRKDEFLATLSHELRNPLAPLQVALDVARLVDDDPEQRSRSLGIMERQVGMLTTLVDELLDLSRITQGKIVLERTPISLAHVLESALIAARPLLDGARHELRVELPDRQLEIDGDFRRLVQVFTNLLINAAKYTPPGGHIGVTVIPGGGKVAVHMQDNGLGIPPDMLPRIFEIFVQSRDARGRSQGGLGIGLNVVRRLIELHGGTVSARSEGAGRGSEFTVELPVRAGAA
jgi:two-component system, chemotaxis family, CheB/CheR fusion protein